MGHEHERLSAYLDGELPPLERAQVDAHLSGCRECADRLAELRAADAALAALPASAPAGYFESFPGRVRARLDAKPARKGLPAWTWAVAAALVLAVVTPLTLRNRPQDAAQAPARETRVEPVAAPAPLPSPSAPPATLESRYEEQKQQADERPRANVPAALQKKEGAFAQAPREADARADAPAAGAVAGAAPEPAPPAAPPPAAALEEEVAASAAPAKPDAAAAAPRQQEAEAKRALPRDAMSDLASGEVDAMGARGRVVRPAPAGTAAAKLLASEAEWQRLETTRPRTPEEWRRLREDWRRFVARDPEGTLADAARLRMIEAGRSAWRASSDPADEAAFREDAAAYLERESAPQKDRVRRLLADPAAR
jgi:hypothetical protein